MGQDRNVRFGSKAVIRFRAAQWLLLIQGRHYNAIFRKADAWVLLLLSIKALPPSRPKA